MKNLLLAAGLLATLALSSLASAQSAQKAAYSITYDVTAKRTVLGATYDVGAEVTDLFGVKKLDLALKPLVGATDLGAGTVGGVGAFRYDGLSKEFFGEFGLGGRVAFGEKPHLYLYIGFGRKF